MTHEIFCPQSNWMLYLKEWPFPCLFPPSCHHSGRINSGGTSEVLLWFLGLTTFTYLSLCSALKIVLFTDMQTWWSHWNTSFHISVIVRETHFISYLNYCETPKEKIWTGQKLQYILVFLHICIIALYLSPIVHVYLQHLDNMETSSFAIQINPS